MEILRGVHVIETYANCVLLIEDKLVLVDTGVEESARDVLDYLESVRRKPTDIAVIVITHTHPDHVGGLAVMKDRTGAKVASHEIEADFISRREQYPGPPGPQRHKPVDVDVLLEDGQRFEGMLVIHTPGHTPGSISLLDEERKLLVAGDAMQTEEGTIGPMNDTYNIDPMMHRESMRKLAKLDFETVIVGHGNAIKSGSSRMLRAAVASL